jgi:hypothetical protein
VVISLPVVVCMLRLRNLESKLERRVTRIGKLAMSMYSNDWFHYAKKNGIAIRSRVDVERLVGCLDEAIECAEYEGLFLYIGATHYILSISPIEEL